MNPTLISANNAFLANIEVIEGGQKKSATLKGKELAKALEHELPDQIQESWARVVRDNEFLGKMAAAVKIRGKMDSSTLESHIAYSASQAKSAQVMTGARAVVDILRAAGVVRENEGQLISTEPTRAPIEVTTHESVMASDMATATVTTPRSESTTLSLPPRAIAGSTSVTLHIELRIDVKSSELDGLGEKIRQLLRELKKPEEDDDGDDS